MRSRFFASIILLLFIGIPGLFYWYFFNKQIASVSISVISNDQFTVELQGTVSSSILPLADKFLVYHQECLQTCSFSPIPPVQYNLVITSTGKIDIQDTFSIKTGEKKNLSYTLYSDVQMDEYKGAKLPDLNLAQSMLDNANMTMSGIFSLVGTDGDKIYAIRSRDNQMQIGLLFPEKFISLRNLPDGSSTASLDSTKKFLLIPLANKKVLLLSVSMNHEIELAITPTSVVYLGDASWKVQTDSGVFSYDGNMLQENPRFTDFLDLSPSKRLGYISGRDDTRLKLSNFPLGESVLVMLDRATGKNYVVKKGADIKTLYFEGDIPVYLDSSGKVWKISIDN